MTQNEHPGKKSTLVFRRCLSLACMFYTALTLLIFLLYLIFVYSAQDKPFSEMLLGGISVLRHVILFGISLAAALLISVLTRKKPKKKPRSSLPGYLRRVCIAYTLLHALEMVLFGLYLDLLYNPYAVTDAVLLKGPCFLLQIVILAFSLVLPFINLLMKARRVPPFLRYLCHLLLLVIAVGVFFQLPANGFGSAKNFLIFSVLFAAGYLIVCLVRLLLSGAKKVDENDALDYQNVYLPKNPDNGKKDSSSDY